MWFFSKAIRKHPERSPVRFLRKAPTERKERRTIPVKKDGNSFPFWVCFLWLVFFWVVFYVAFFSPLLAAQKRSVSGAHKVSEDTIIRFVDNELFGTYLGILPKKSLVLIRPRALEEHIRLAYPLFRDVRVKRIFPDGIRIEVEEREKLFIWCSDGRCDLVDETGIARDGSHALLPENEPYVITVSDTSDQSVTIGEEVVDPRYAAFAIGIYAAFPERFGIALEPRFTTTSRFADELRVKTDEGWEIYFGTDISPELSFQVLALLLENELSKEKRARLAYVDLRAENRAYYAFRPEENGTSFPETVPAPTENLPEEKASQKKKK